MNFKTNADLKLKCKKRMNTNVGFDVSRVLQFKFPAVLLAMEEYHQPIWVWIIQRDYNIPDLNFYKNFQKLSVFQIHYFIKYITFKNTKLSAALLNDTNKKQNIFTFIIIYLINRTL